MLPVICPEWGSYRRNSIDIPGNFYPLIIQWLPNHHPDFEKTMNVNKSHHQNNITILEIWLIGHVGVKDRRIDTIFHPGMRSPILHPYAWCRHYARNANNNTEIPSIFLDFFIPSSFNNCVITIRILKGDDESELNHIMKNISMVVDLSIGHVGVKDRRIDTIFHPRLRSPILHPYP